MRLTVLGACGAWPEPGQACSGFLLQHEDFNLVIDLGYATMPRLLMHVDAADVDAVFIRHGHPDHCADLNPLLRARAQKRVHTKLWTSNRARSLRSDRLGPRPCCCPTGCLTS